MDFIELRFVDSTIAEVIQLGSINRIAELCISDSILTSWNRISRNTAKHLCDKIYLAPTRIDM
jgi:hypothetical protein